MKHAPLSLSSFPSSVCLQTQEREPSRRPVFNWVPALALVNKRMAGMIGLSIYRVVKTEFLILTNNTRQNPRYSGYSEQLNYISMPWTIQPLFKRPEDRL